MRVLTLRTETFAGRNFHVFRVFGPFSRKFIPLEISKQQNAKVFSREIIDNFKNAKVFSREKRLFLQAKEKTLSMVVGKLLESLMLLSSVQKRCHPSIPSVTSTQFWVMMTGKWMIIVIYHR